MAVTTVPTSTPTSQPIPAQPGRRLDGYQHRREVPSTPAPGTGVDPHPAWWAEASALIDLINGPAPEGLTIKEEDGLVARQDKQYGDLFARIAETPARTLAGVQTQLAVALFCAENWQGDRNEPVVAALKSAVVTLEQLAGRA